MDKKKESAAYKGIVAILENSCDLTSHECYVLRGWLAYCAGKAEKKEAFCFDKTAQSSKPHHSIDHTPNITMINCSQNKI